MHSSRRIDILKNIPDSIILNEKAIQILTEIPIRATELGASSLAGSLKRNTPYVLLLFRGLSS